MTTKLHIGKGFSLPLELVTSTQAILARKRSGKSYTASVQAEELLEHKQQVVVIDPTSAWWGLRSSADGTGAGYPVVVFGGDHEDAPLDYRAGRAMAKAVVEHGFSAIFDIGNLHTEEQVQFVMEFCSELLRINRQALHIFMDEADTFAPQKPLGLLQNKCLGTVSRLVKQGGIRGLGFTMITQRPASINKDVLSQVDILTVLRMSHPLDIKAATDWIKSEVTVEFAKEVETALPSLPVGTAFFCSASLKIGKRVEVRTRTTFNSGATPKPGERREEPKVLAKVDIEKLGQQIAASVKRAKEDSPEYLKQRIQELEAQIANGGTANMGLAEDIQAMERELEELRPLKDRVANAEQAAQDRAGRLTAFLYHLKKMIAEYEDGDKSWESWRQPPAPEPQGKVMLEKPASVTPSPEEGRVTYVTNPTNPTEADQPSGLQARILRSLAEFEAIRRQHVPRSTLSAWAEARGGYFDRTVSAMKTAGLLEYPTAGSIALTEKGRELAPKISAPPTRAAFFEACVRQSGGGLNERIMRALKAVYPEPMPREKLSSTGDARGGYFDRTVSALKTAGFIEYATPGTIRLQQWTQML